MMSKKLKAPGVSSMAVPKGSHRERFDEPSTRYFCPAAPVNLIAKSPPLAVFEAGATTGLLEDQEKPRSSPKVTPSELLAATRKK